MRPKVRDAATSRSNCEGSSAFEKGVFRRTLGGEGSDAAGGGVELLESRKDGLQRHKLRRRCVTW